MTDILVDIGGGLKKRFKDMGDGTVAEVISLAGGGGAIGTISGLYKVGQTLTFTPSTGYTVTAGNWTRDGVNISGATAFTYPQVAADVGHAISYKPTTWSYSAPGGTTAASEPDAPTIGTATAGNGVANINWSAPANNGGSAITGYKVTGSNGNIVTAAANATTAALPASNGSPVSAIVQALNDIGYGPASAASNAVTPIAPAAPSAPQNVVANPANESVFVTWDAPTSDGGSALGLYTVTLSNGQTKTTSGTMVSVPSTNNAAVTASVTVANAAGGVSPAGVSSSVTPSGNLRTTQLYDINAINGTWYRLKPRDPSFVKGVITNPSTNTVSFRLAENTATNNDTQAQNLVGTMTLAPGQSVDITSATGYQLYTNQVSASLVPNQILLIELEYTP